MATGRQKTSARKRLRELEVVERHVIAAQVFSAKAGESQLAKLLADVHASLKKRRDGLMGIVSRD